MVSRSVEQMDWVDWTFLAKKRGIIERTSLEQKFFELLASVEKLDLKLLDMSMEAISWLSKAEKCALHDDFHKNIPSRAQVGKKLSASVLVLCAPMYVLRHDSSNKTTLSERIEQCVACYYDAKPSDVRRAMARTLVDVLQAFQELDVASLQEIYYMPLEKMTLKSLWEVSSNTIQEAEADSESQEDDEEQKIGVQTA